MAEESQDTASNMSERVPGWFVPWKTDSLDLLEAGKKPAALSRLRVIRPKGLDDFLDNADSLAQVLVGARGSGKSLVLAMKAARVREQEGKQLASLMGNHPFVNRLSKAKVRIPIAAISTYADHDSWVKIWTLLLGSAMAFVLLRKEDIPFNPKDEDNRIHWLIKKFFNCQPSKNPEKPGAFEFLADVGEKVFSGNIELVVPVLQNIIRIGAVASVYQDWFEQYVLGVLSRGHEDAKYVAYIDGIDEMLADSAGEALFPSFDVDPNSVAADAEATDNHRVLASECWIAAQTGFVDSVATLRNDTLDRIRIYGAAREEVYERYISRSSLGPLKAKTRVLVLKYSPEELLAVFGLNVEFTQDKAKPDGATSAEQLFGFDSINSSIVWNREETIFQHMLRHTFNSPRGLVEVAHAALTAVSDPKQRSTPGGQALIIRAINDAAKDVLAEHKQAVLPRWFPRLQEGLPLISTNIISHAIGANIERRFAEKTKRFEDISSLPDDFFNKTENWQLIPGLYSRGLIGIPRIKPLDGTVYLEFLKPDGHEKSVSQKQAYFALHPALASEVYSILPTDEQLTFYSCEMVVGNELPAVLDIKNKEIGVRFDAGAGVKVYVRGQEVGIPDEPGNWVQPFFVIAALMLAMSRNKSNLISLKLLQAEADKLFSTVEHSALGTALSPERKKGALNTKEVAIFSEIRRGLNYTAAQEQPRLVKKIKPLLEKFGLHWAFRGGTEPSFGLEWLAQRGQLIDNSAIEVRMF